MVDKKVILLFAIFLLLPSLGYAENWWNSSWHMRIPINISYTSDMENASVKVNINFTQLISELNVSGNFDQNSIRVVESGIEIPHDFENETYDKGNVSWIANGTTLANTNRTFWIYFDIIENGLKEEGKIISEKPYWKSGYTDDMDVWSNQTTSPGIGYEWNRSWAESLEVSWKWCTEASADWAYLYVDGVQVRKKDGTGGSEVVLFQGSKLASRFTSDLSYKPPECSDYGTYVEWIKFYQTANYTTPPLSVFQGDPELQPLSITVETDKNSYNYNETIVISGVVKDANGLAVNASNVDLKIFFPNGTQAYSNTIQTNSSGYYSDNLTITWNDAGVYSVNVTAYKFSYSNGTNSTTFYYTANREPTLGNMSVSPSLGGWGENFTYSVDVYDFEGDVVNVTLWTNENGVWTKHETKSISPPGTLSWIISPFSCSDVGITRSYKFEYRDGNHSLKNTTENSGPTIEKDDITLEYLIGNESTVNRSGNYYAKLGVRIKDIDRNQYVSSETVSFWVYYFNTWNIVGSNASESDGNATFNFNPNCSVEVGLHNWKANYSGSCYKNNDSETFTLNVIGQLLNNLELPLNGSIYHQGDTVIIRGNLTDECSVLISDASVNFSVIVNTTEYYCSVNDEGSGYYNCSWNSFAKPTGNYSIKMNSSKVNYNSNETLWIKRFELLPGPPRITINITPLEFEQLGGTQINATVLDQSGSGIQWVKVNITRPNGIVDSNNMTQIESNVWTINYNNSWGNTSLRGIYNVTVYSMDNNGNIGNATDSFKVYAKLVIILETLSSNYYQGDTGTIYYKVKDSNNVSLENVSVILSIKNPQNLEIFRGSYSTNSKGLIEPLPQFTISSDAALGNYSLNSYSSFYDPQALSTSQENSSSNFTVHTAEAKEGIFTEVETAVVWYPDNIMRFSIRVYTIQGNPTDPDDFNLTVYDPADNIYFKVTKSNTTRESEGIYLYKYAMPVTTATGDYRAEVEVVKAGFVTKDIKPFRVASGGPYDVRINLLETEVSPGENLPFQIVIENKGEVDQDVHLEYWVSDGKVWYNASEAVYVASLENKTLEREVPIFSQQPTGLYYLNVKVTYSYVQPPIQKAATFSVVSAAPPAPPAPPTGFAPLPPPPKLPIARIEITNYSEEILVEKGWIKYTSFLIKNTGEKDLHNVYVSIEGEHPEWFKIETNKTEVLAPNETVEFFAKLSVPMSAEAGVYSFYVNAKSDEASDRKSFIVRVFSSRAELLLYQIQTLREKIDRLEEKMRKAEREGKDVSLIRDMIDEARGKLNSAEGYVYRKGYDKAIELIRDVEDLTKEIEYEISVAPPIKPPPMLIPVEWLIILILLTILIMLLIYNFLKRKTPQKILPEVNLKEMIVEKDKKGKINKELEELREACSLIEEEFKEGLLSKESYEELKSKYEEKISLLERKLKGKEIKGEKE